MLTKPHRQEALSRAYVQIVSACCGMACNTRAVDYGIDLSLHEIADEGAEHCESGFAIDVQARSTTVAAVGEAEVKYDLDVRTYNFLRSPTAACPRLLVLLVLPEDEGLWVSLTGEELVLRRCAYWLGLRGREQVPNVRSIRVALPVGNRFTPEALRGILGRLKEGGTP